MYANWVGDSFVALLVVPEEHLAAWEGSEPPSPGRTIVARSNWLRPGPITDYDRALDIKDLGRVSVGNGYGLVLGMQSWASWLAEVGGGTLVRWLHGGTEADLFALVESLPAEAFTDTGLFFSVDFSPLVLMGATDCQGEHAWGRQDFDLPPGRYRILACDCERDGVWVICYRFVLEQTEDETSTQWQEMYDQSSWRLADPKYLSEEAEGLHCHSARLDEKVYEDANAAALRRNHASGDRSTGSPGEQV